MYHIVEFHRYLPVEKVNISLRTKTAFQLKGGNLGLFL